MGKESKGESEEGVGRSEGGGRRLLLANKFVRVICWMFAEALRYQKVLLVAFKCKYMSLMSLNGSVGGNGRKASDFNRNMPRPKPVEFLELS